jgi:U32 family peptidase
MDTQELEVGDKMQIIGPTTGVYEAIVSEMFSKDQPVQKVGKGEHPTIPVSRTVRRNDKVFRVVANNH